MLINQKVSKIYKSDEALFVRTVFETSITFPHLDTELSIILSKYLPFLQVHAAWFQI